jgi:uncharacterized protein YodC (DUF2158 family)
MAQFKKGDVVELKSGGLKMTVDDVTEAGMVKCIWFEKSAKYEDFFGEHLLQEYKRHGIGMTVI